MMQAAAQKRLTVLSIVISAALVAAAGAFGFSRDFGMFLLGIIVLAGLLIVALVVLLAATATDRGSRGVKTSAILVLLAPVAAYGASHVRDRVLFIGWSIAHRAVLPSAVSKDVVITGWDRWGMAGSSNESYLVADKLDDSSDIAGADRWRTRMGLSCPIVATKRMRKSIYIVTTYECSFDSARVPYR